MVHNDQFGSSILHTFDSCGNGGSQCIGAFDGLYSEFRITITELLILKGERLVDNEPKHKISMAICFDSESIFFAVAALNIFGHSRKIKIKVFSKLTMGFFHFMVIDPSASKS